MTALVALLLLSAFKTDTNDTITVFMIGDSTMANKPLSGGNQERGWGQMLPGFFTENVRVDNHAQNGRSSKSFINEKRWDAVLAKIRKGDYVFIQFGHNDEKKNDPQRYTDPYSDYMVNLEKFVNAARNKGAWPVFITPLERRCFIDEEHLDIGEHTDYVAAMKQTAENLNVPLIDLYSMSRAEMRKAGAEKTKEWYMHLPAGVYPSHMDGLTDNTHLKYMGAVVYAGCIARGLKELGGIYSDLLVAWE